MKIDRLLGILSTLLQQNKVTAPYLADRFEVSRRTISRDIEDLCMAGIPVVTVQGKNGGISIMEGFKIDKTLFTSREMQAILSGLRSLDSVSGSNRYQLLIDKFAVPGPDMVPVNNHILINLASWYKSSLIPKIELIQSAIEHKKCLSFYYYSPVGEGERCIEPYYLLFEWSSWYVWGFCCLRQDFRLFKLNRLDQLRCLETSIELRDVPAVPLKQKSVFHEKDVEATVEFHPEVKWRLYEEFGNQGYEVVADGWIRMTVKWSGQESLLSWLMPFREYARIIGPEEIRTGYLKIINDILKSYG